MLHHILEILVWLLLAFIVGALFGCVLRNLFGGARERDAAERITGPGASEGYAGEGVMQARAAAASSRQGLVSGGETTTAEREAKEEAARKRAEEEAARKRAEEEAARKRAEEAAAKKAEEEAARKRAEGAEEEKAAAAKGDDEKWKVPVLGLKEPVAGEPDDLEMISGIGPKLAKMLHDMGIYYFAQIARWTDEIIAEVDGELKFKGRIQRDEWVRQAKLLAEGKLEQFEREYGTGGLKDKSGKTRSGTRTRKKAKKQKS